MMLNIFKYQIPQLQYVLFKDYIAKNICVKKSEKNNCCQGKCYLKQQLKQVEETNGDKPSNQSNNSKKNQNNENTEFFLSHILFIKPAETTVILPVNYEAYTLQGYALAFFVPPKTNLFLIKI
jgi:hypothetical protein